VTAGSAASAPGRRGPGQRTACGTCGPDLAPGDDIIVNCWGRGQNVSAGNVWYKVSAEIYNHLGGVRQNVTGQAP
jgi:hypothetical protein